MALGQPAAAGRAPRPEQVRRGRTFLAVYSTLVALATAVFVGLAFTVRTEDLVVNFDAPVARAVQDVQAPVLSWLLAHASDLGWHPYDILCVIVIAVALLVLRLRIEAVLIVASTLLAGGLGAVVKEVVQRARPTANFVHLAAHLADFSFPSGHVIFATVLFGTTCVIVWIVWPSSLIRNLVLAVLALPVLLMGPSRVYLGEHWPTDVLGAYCLAGIWVAISIEVLLVVKTHSGAWWQGRAYRRKWKGIF